MELIIVFVLGALLGGWTERKMAKRGKGKPMPATDPWGAD